MIPIPAKLVTLLAQHVLEQQLPLVYRALMDTCLKGLHANLDVLRVNSYQVVNAVHVVTTAKYASIVPNVQFVHLDYWFQQLVDAFKNAMTEHLLLMDHARNVIQLAQNVMMHQLMLAQHVLLDS